jgi:hypothetical protein
LEADKAEKFIEKVKDAKIIGRVELYKDYLLKIR